MNARRGDGAPCVPVGTAQVCVQASPGSSYSAASVDGGPSAGAYGFVSFCGVGLRPGTI